MSLLVLARDLWWWAQDYAYALAWQLGGLFAGRPKSYLSGDGRPVVVIPGIWESWTFMVPLIRRLHRAGHPVHVIVDLGLNRRSVADTAGVAAEFLRDHDLRDVALVAHSKGGVIGKYLMTFLDTDSRVALMAAVAAPFTGSAYARYLVLPSLRALSPTDPTTVLLTASTAANSRIVSIFGVFDPHIPEGSALVGATNIELDDGGHFRLLGRASVGAIVVDAVEGREIAHAAASRGGAIANDTALRALTVALSLDTVCVLALIVMAAVVTHRGGAGVSVVAWGYAAIGAAGLAMAAIAVARLATIGAATAVSPRRASQATGLLLGGLAVNTVGGILVLVLSLAEARSSGASAALSIGMALFLVVGGDILSAVYLVLVRAVGVTSV